jgi:hypothetical protein
MKKLLTVISLLLLLFANAECTILYLEDDSGSGGCSSASSSTASSAVISVTTATSVASITGFMVNADNSDNIYDQIGEIRAEISYLRDLLAGETNPTLISQYQSQINTYTEKMATLETAARSNSEFPTNQYKSILDILNNIIKSLRDTIQSIIRNF